MKAQIIALALAVGGIGMTGLTGCTTSPETAAQRETLSDRADTTLAAMQRSDSGLHNILNSAYGYAVFPDAGKAGLVVGGSFGRGEVYQAGKFIGYAKLEQGTIGAQVGGQTFDELIIFQDMTALMKFKHGEWAPAANASAVILKSGAAASTPFKDGVMTLIDTKGGAMAEAAVGGQKFTFEEAMKRDAQ